MGHRRTPVRRRRRRLLLGGAGAAVAVVVVVALALSGGGSGSTTVSVRGRSAPRVGDVAPSFSAPTVSGTRFVSPTRRPTLLYFIAGWCGTCLPGASALARVAPSVSGRADLVAIDADPSDSWASLRSFVAAVGAPAYPFAKDDGHIGPAFAVTALDTAVGIDASGRVAYRSVGALGDEAAVRAALTKIGVSA